MCHSIGRDCRKSRTPLVCFKEMTRNVYAKLKWNCALAKNATTNIKRRITLCSKPWTPFWKLLSVVKARERAFCVFLVPTKKARKGCRERPALYHESPDYLSMFLDQVYERLKDSRNLPFLCMLRILKKPKRDVTRKKISQSEIKNEKRNNSEK